MEIDGLADLIIGARYSDLNGIGSGSSFIVFGKNGNHDAVKLLDVANGNGGFAIKGESYWDTCGYSVSAAGDVNGDGIDDLILGAPGANVNGSQSGSTYVVFGKKVSNGPVDLSEISVGNGGFVIHGEFEDDHSGSSVCSAGDVNADGLDDLIIGARGADPNGEGSGRSYVVFGKKGNYDPIQLSEIATGNGGFVVNGVSESDYSGFSVSSAGDFNGDGLADLLIGAHGEDNYTGKSYVLL